jgi:cytidine deaminase
MGVDTKAVYKWVERTLHSLHYDSHHIKLTDYLKTKNFDFELEEKPIEKRYETYINGCNAIREQAKRSDFFAAVAIQKIIDARSRTNETDDPGVPAARTAYVVDQIKRPEEADALQSIYGKQFILISCHIPINARRKLLARRIAEYHASQPKMKNWQPIADELIDIDEKESSKPYGQRVSDVFPKADLIIDTSTEKAAREQLTRFFEALFGNFKVSPTRNEFFQNIAFNVSLTSCDTARQVGAVIQKNGDLMASGFNEAPRAFGGTYWADEGLDARDIALGKDINTVRKRQMVVDLIQRLRDAEALKNNKIADHEIEAYFLDGQDAPLRKSQIMDSLEYGRAVHAEMAALSMAARVGISVDGGSLYCTTFPCHNCAKHIVASGIKKVYYLEPYAKSFADELYPDSIEIDRSSFSNDKVVFQQFVGITPKRFNDVFAKERLKDEKGNVSEWNPKESQPIIGKLDQDHIDREVIFQKRMLESLDNETAIYLGLETEATNSEAKG